MSFVEENAVDDFLSQVEASVDQSVRSSLRQERLKRQLTKPSDDTLDVDGLECAYRCQVLAWCKDHGYHDVNAPKKTLRGVKKFPLHTAVKRGDKNMVQMLLQCGANKNVRDSRGRTPKDCAEDATSHGVKEWMLKRLS